MIKWKKINSEESCLIRLIVKRAVKIGKKAGVKVSGLDTDMNITACHVSGCKLKLQELLDADDFNFAHDVFGIAGHINRKTGKIERNFVPRFKA